MNKKFIKDVTFTTAIAFLIITFVFVGFTALVDDSEASFERYVFMRYIFAKLSCIFLFSLSLGFINRIFDAKKIPQMFKRIIHFVLASISFLLFMVLMFNSLYDGAAEKIEMKTVVSNYLLFVVCDLVTVGVCALFKKITAPKNNEEYKPFADK